MRKAMGSLDISLKIILNDGRTRLLRSIGIPGDYTEMVFDVPSNRDRDVDFLAVMKQGRGRPFLVHVELQTTISSAMTDRMLGYYADILDWASSRRKFRGMSIRQTVIYVGPKRWRPEITIDEPGLRYTHGFIDARDMDPKPLFDSENLADVAFAVLCRDGKRPEAIRKMLARIAAAPAAKRARGLATLNALADLRSIGPRVRSEMEKMGID
jgi:hypothetical protein